MAFGCRRRLIVAHKKLVEDVRQLLRRDPRSGVVDRGHDLVVDCCDRESNLVSPRSELAGIGDEIAEDLVDTVVVPIDRFRKPGSVFNLECDVALLW